VSIQIISSQNKELKKIIITDLSGKILIEKTDDLLNIDVKNLENGLYILNILGVNYNTMFKFIKV
jgi:hypothetical protein